MECTSCINENRIETLEKNEIKIQSKLEEHEKAFEQLRTKDAVREERDKSIASSLNFIQTSIAELKGSVSELRERPTQTTVKRVDNVCHICGYCYIPSAISSGSRVDLVRIDDHAPSILTINRQSHISDSISVKADQIAHVAFGTDGVIACNYATTDGYIFWDFTYIV